MVLERFADHLIATGASLGERRSDGAVFEARSDGSSRRTVGLVDHHCRQSGAVNSENVGDIRALRA